jgi:cytochrome c553
MRAAAEEAAQASRLEGAARATAKVAAACGDCHQGLEAEVSFEADELPPEGGDVTTHMRRHAWAAARMWDGMIVPSGVVWDEGAEALAVAPLTPAQLEVDIEVLADVSAMEAEVHELAATATGITSQGERADLYGRFLGTCASCHQKAGRGTI